MERTTHWAALYFVALMTFGNYVLFNLLVAILVEGFSNQDDLFNHTKVSLDYSINKYHFFVQNDKEALKDDDQIKHDNNPDIQGVEPSNEEVIVHDYDKSNVIKGKRYEIYHEVLQNTLSFRAKIEN